MEMTKPALSLLKIISLFLFLQLIAFPNLVIPHTLNSDQEILLSIKYQMIARHFSILRLWNSTVPCNWVGVECTKDNIVTGISINGIYIENVDEILASICNLKNLTYLDLSGNSITCRSFPTFLYNCTNLQSLYLGYNILSGEIPNDLSHRYPKLKHLDLSGNEFSGEIPSSIVRLKNMVTLNLQGNEFSGTIPSELGNLENLEELHLSNNSFSAMKLPKEFGKLKKLKVLMMGGCSFIGQIPESYTNLSSLEQLDLSYNGLVGEIPTSICNLKNLIHLDIGGNAIAGHFPTFLYNCTNLQSLILNQNLHVGKLPNDIGNLSSQLKHLDFSYNLFTGNIPRSIVQLKDLVTLYLQGNQLNGSIPSELGKLKNLEELDLGYNNLVGDIPSGLFMLNNLTYLHLNQNLLSRGLPISIEAAINLKEIDLSMNNLNGPIPPDIGKLLKLESLNLNLNFNRFSGSIPRKLSAHSALLHIDLSYNKLTGKIPPELGWLRFDSLDLSYNYLSGNIPATLDNVTDKCNFLHNSNLCSDSLIWNLPRCSSHHFSISHLLIILLLPVAIIVLIVIYIIFGKQKHEAQQPADWTMTPFHNINFTEAKIVNGLTEDNVVGSGGSGKIYLVNVDDSSNKVAVKRMWENKKMSHALEKQIMAEAEILGKIRHVNIVKLLCFISKEGSKLLVYEYMENHSLDEWLHRKQNTQGSSASRSLLDWPTRLKIAIGAAKGLCYMHHACSPPVIHRDVKSSNILLDSEFNAKIADFGLAKMSPEYKIGEPRTASGVAGSFGYIAPEYWRTRRVSEKIDMYSFGVVLLELATGKEACKGNDHLNLAEWSWKHHIIEGHPMEDILDGEIKDPSNLREMINVLKVGLMCTSIVPSSRPSMKQVVKMLTEYTCNEAYERTTQIDNDEEPINIFIGDNVMSP